MYTVGDILQCNILQCNILQCNILQCDILQCDILRYTAVVSGRSKADVWQRLHICIYIYIYTYIYACFRTLIPHAIFATLNYSGPGWEIQGISSFGWVIQGVEALGGGYKA